MLSANEIKAFRRTVYASAAHQGRRFPWRRTRNPYRILVSELMLQQTQTSRVEPKYREFLRSFPDLRILAAAPLGEVLRAWQGLGYNRRARYLHRAAQEAVLRFGGRLPRDPAALQTLSGIGPYTAGAVAAFAFNRPVVLIETNIRSVYISHFFPGGRAVSDRDLVPFIEATLDRNAPRDWYNALMDYGSLLKRGDRALTRRSAHHVKQSPFRGSNRQLRGAIVRALAAGNGYTVRRLQRSLSFEAHRVKQALGRLEAEGLIVRAGIRYRLP